jgi:hypothetical protein
LSANSPRSRGDVDVADPDTSPMRAVVRAVKITTWPQPGGMVSGPSDERFGESGER